MKKIVLLFAACACIFAGCNNNPEDNLEQEDYQVAISFTTESASLLKSEATEPEDAITKIKLFGVDASNNVTPYPVENIANKSARIQLTISRSIKSLYAIGNPTNTLETATPSTVSDLMDLVDNTNFTSAPQSPYLMSGMVTISSYTEDINISLVRAVAKVKITSTNFAFTSVTVKNTPDKGYVFAQASLSVPGGSESLKDYNPITLTGTAPVNVPMLYVAENSKSTPTKFEVTGTYNNKTATYGIELKDKLSGLYIDIVRNTYYKVNIEPVTESECIITISIPDWEDVETQDHEIQDNDFTNP